MVKDLLKNGEEKMKSVISSTKKAFAGIRTGRANPSLLDRIHVDYYGTQTPLTQMANISAPEARLLLIQPWDKSVIKSVEKAIQTSDLGLVPNNDGSVIRIAIPQLTEERRKELVKVMKREAEERRVAVRNVRRDLNDEAKSMEKAGDISEDELRRALDDIQELTNDYIAKIDELAEQKEQEILEV